jgi:hypothetical protein
MATKILWATIVPVLAQFDWLDELVGLAGGR